MAFKRKRVYAPKRNGFKRKRTNRRRSLRGRKTSAYTSKSAQGHTFSFKSKRLSRQRWKKMLWDSTLQSTHYRSLNAFTVNSTSPANTTTYQVQLIPALRFAGSQFYIPAGGLVPTDGAVLTGFVGNIVIRGGTIGLSLTNIGSITSTMRFKVFLVKTSRAWTGLSLPANPVLGFDPSIIVDFQLTIGRILLAKDFILDNNTTMDLKYRLPVYKIDRDEYDQDKNSYVWVVYGNDTEAGSSVWSNQAYYNLSFAADAIGTA